MIPEFCKFAKYCVKIVKMWINKVVVGSGCGDVPKYTGEGVASHGPPGNPGGPFPRFYSHFQAIS